MFVICLEFFCFVYCFEFFNGNFGVWEIGGEFLFINLVLNMDKYVFIKLYLFCDVWMVI